MGNGNLQHTTLDCYLAGFLVLRGHTPNFISEGSKIVFAFPATQELFKNISDYNNGSKVEALRLVNTIKMLRGQIFARRENGKGKNFHGKSSSF